MKQILHPFEAWLSTHLQKICVDREADEQNPWLELELRPTHQRVVGDKFDQHGRVTERSTVITYVRRMRLAA